MPMSFFSSFLPARIGAPARAALCFGLVAALLLALALLVSGTHRAAAQTTRTITMSIDGDGAPAGFTYPTMTEGAPRTLRFTLDSPAPAGGIDIGSPGTAQNGNTQVASTLINEGETSIGFPIHPNDDTVDNPNYAYVHPYPNTPPGGAFTVVPADGRITLTVVDNDPTVVTLRRVDTGGATLDEGDTAQLEVSLSRPLVGAGDHGPEEIIVVPLQFVGVFGAVRGDWDIALNEDAPNTGVSLDPDDEVDPDEATHSRADPVVTFRGAGAQTAVLDVALKSDHLTEGLELLWMRLAPDEVFDATGPGEIAEGTNVGGGADPMTSGGAPPIVKLNIRNVENVVDVPHDWSLIPSGLQPGDLFRLLFITTGSITATSTDITTYDDHVRGQITNHGLAAIRPYAPAFRVVGSTSSVNARDHTGLTGAGVPIYWLNGPLVAQNNAGFWSDTWENWSQTDRRTQFGMADTHSDWPWTGTNTDGTAHANHLGHAIQVQRGQFSTGPSSTGPISHNSAPSSQSHTLYGISPVFSVARDAPFDLNYKQIYEGERKTMVVSGLTGLTVSVSVTPDPSSSEYRIYPLVGTVGEVGIGNHPFNIMVINGLARFDLEALVDAVDDPLELEFEFTQSGERIGKARVQLSDGNRGPSMLFRTCPSGGCSPGSDAGWVESDRPLVQLREGGRRVTYQYQLIGHTNQAFGEASVRIEDTRKMGPHNVGVGLADWDRIRCHGTEDHGTMTPVGVSSSILVTSATSISTTQWHDLFGGCPYHANQMSWAERDGWQTVTFSAGHDADAYDEAIVLEHRVRVTAPGGGYVYDGPPGQEGAPGPPRQRRVTVPAYGPGYVDLRIVDDDDWDQEFLYSGDGGATWTKASDGGLREAIPDELEVGATHDVWIKLLNPSLATHRSRDYIYVKVSGCNDRFGSPVCDVGVSPNSYGNDRPSSFTDLDWGTSIYADAKTNAAVRLRLHVKEDAEPGTRKTISFWTYGWLGRTDTDLPDPSLRQPGPNRNTASRSISGLRYEETRVVEVVPDTAKQVVALPPTLTIASVATSVTEGGDVTFTVTADPAPQFDVTVNVAVDEEMGSGVDLVANSQLTTIIIPAHQATTTWTVTTYSDEVDLADGTVVGRIMPDHRTPSGYTVGAPSSVTLTLVDDDPVVADQIVDGVPEDASSYTVDPALIVEVQAHIDAFTARKHAAGIRDWNLILDRLEGRTGMSDARIASWLQDSTRYGWQDGIVTLPKVQAALAAMAAQQTQQTPPPTPEVNITAAAGGTEGSAVTFTVSANPAPAADLAVSVTVTTSGDYGVTAGSRTVTIAGGMSSKTLTLQTTDDSTDEADGSVTLTLNGGSGYTLGQVSSETVQVQDDDHPQQQQPVVTPVVSITAGSGVTEGGNTSFTLTANPAPASPITVSVTVTADGDYGAVTGSRTVTIPTGGSVTFTVGTTDDGNDEADGSVTATVNGGDGYTVSSSQGAATVRVADDDVPMVSISGGGGVTEGGDASFTLTANPAPASALSVSVTVTAGGDYGATTGSRTVTVPTTGSATLTLPTTDDSTDEADGSVTVTLVDGADYDLGTNQAATVAVSDDDEAAPTPVSTVTVSIEDASASESASDLMFDVVLSEASNEDITVTWFTQSAYSGNRARGGQGSAYDYWHASGQILIRAGETRGTGTVWLNQDSEDEGNEVFMVTIYSRAGPTVEDGEGTMTIVDDD